MSASSPQPAAAAPRNSPAQGHRSTSQPAAAGPSQHPAGPHLNASRPAEAASAPQQAAQPSTQTVARGSASIPMVGPTPPQVPLPPVAATYAAAASVAHPAPQPSAQAVVSAQPAAHVALHSVAVDAAPQPAAAAPPAEAAQPAPAPVTAGGDSQEPQTGPASNAELLQLAATLIPSALLPSSVVAHDTHDCDWYYSSDDDEVPATAGRRCALTIQAILYSAQAPDRMSERHDASTSTLDSLICSCLQVVQASTGRLRWQR